MGTKHINQDVQQQGAGGYGQSGVKKRIKKTHDYNNLPIAQKKHEIINLIKKNQVIILSGETGSGKTTQIPKYCLEAGLGRNGKVIACTQPRRIAALSVASRIAQELNVNVGEKVGYKIRFDEKTSSKTRIKLMTDGVLLAETQGDRNLSRYDAIIVDEAHERSLNIDFLLGILKKLIEKRKDLKIIITSATIDTQKFSKSFNNAPIIEVSGRTFPVEVRYRPADPDEGEESLAEAGADALEEILLETHRGDVLIFMPTEQDIIECCDVIFSRYSQCNLNILPLYARLSSTDQNRIFQSTGQRKIVVSTNVAETSLTIPGIVYVIDTGVARIARYSPSSGTFGLPVESISRSSADQRKGRCGRIEKGICIRLYSEEDYLGRSLYTPPEVLRTNLAEVILRMLSLKIHDIDNFPFVDKPSSAGIRDGFKTLEELKAIREVKNRDKKSKNHSSMIKILTKEGYRMAEMPMDPRLSKMILQSQREGCTDEALILAGALSIHDPRERPQDKAGQANEKHREFRHDQSDFLTLINIWKGWRDLDKGRFKLGTLKKYCQSHFLSFRRMKEWRDLYWQFKSILMEKNITITPFTGSEDSYYEAVHKSVLAGFLSHISLKKDKNIYEATRKREAMIFPGSQLFNGGGSWVVSSELVKTSRLFMRVNANINSEWVSQVGAHLLKKRYVTPWYDDKKGEVLCKEEVKIFGFLLSNDRTVPYGRFHPKEAQRQFVLDGLMGEETLIGREPDFLKENRRTIEQVKKNEDKLRRRDIYIGDEFVERFYLEQISRLGRGMDKPRVIYDLSDLNRAIKVMGDGTLRLSESELMGEKNDWDLNFPEYMIQDSVKLPLTYQFQPGSEEDGVTLTIAKNRLSQIDLDSLYNTVPGRDRELITALLKSLPKNKRKKLIPLNSHIDLIMSHWKPSRDIKDSLAALIYSQWGLPIGRDDWDDEKIPDHLKLRFSLVNNKGKVIKTSRDKGFLYEEKGKFLIKGEASTSLREKWERAISHWETLDLPDYVSNGNEKFYPRLVKRDEGIFIKLFTDSNVGDGEHKRAVLSFFIEDFKGEMKNFTRMIGWEKKLPREIIYVENNKKILDCLWLRVFTDLLDPHSCRHREECLDVRSALASRLYDSVSLYSEKALVVIEEYANCRRLLSKVRGDSIGRNDEYYHERESDLNDLMGNDFPIVYTFEEWDGLTRFIKTLCIRIEKYRYDPGGDLKKFQEWSPYKDKITGLRNDLSPYASSEKKEKLKELTWLLEEYKVSLFGGGQIKTGTKVSPKIMIKKIEAYLAIT